MMRVYLLAFVIAAATNAHAKCMAPQAAVVWPEAGATVGPSDVYLFQAPTDDIDAMVKTASFQAPNQKPVPVVLVEKLTAGVAVDAVLVRASRPLSPGAWKLSIAATKTVVNVVVQMSKPSSAPTWLTQPSVQRSVYEQFGCGPASILDVAAPMQNASLVRATLAESAKPDAAVTYVLVVHDGRISVGHGMCGGSFSMTPGVPYTLQLQALSNSGVVSEAATLAVVGPAPTP